MISYEGKQIILRDRTLKDKDDWIFWRSPGRYWQKFDGPYYPRKSKGEEVHRIEEYFSKEKSNRLETPRNGLAIADKETNQLIGEVSRYWESRETNWLCIGIAVYNPEHWGKGRGYEALALWTDYLFQAMPEIVRVDLRTWSGNFGMMRLAEKLGYTKEACFRKARIVDGEYYDSIGYGVLREEWESWYPEGFQYRAE